LSDDIRYGVALGGGLLLLNFDDPLVRDHTIRFGADSTVTRLPSRPSSIQGNFTRHPVWL
jgi:hypothetical protein